MIDLWRWMREEFPRAGKEGHKLITQSPLGFSLTRGKSRRVLIELVSGEISFPR